jgi:putative phosphoesterase
MKIGIISDTHNNIELTGKAVDIFKENNIELIVHAGDLTSPRMLELFRDFPCKIVLGNGDIDVEEICDICNKMGNGCAGERVVFEAGGKRIIAFHGDNVAMFREAVVSGEYDYIIKGHTHYFENYVSNNTRVINPGSLYGSDEFSIAVLDTDEDRVTRIRVEE